MHADWTAIIVIESAVKRVPMVKRTCGVSIPVSSTDPEHYFMGALQSLTTRLVLVADIVNSSRYGRIVRSKFPVGFDFDVYFWQPMWFPECGGSGCRCPPICECKSTAQVSY